MKSDRPVERAKTPKDLAMLYREWQELRIKVSKAELAAARETALAEAKIARGPYRYSRVLNGK